MSIPMLELVGMGFGMEKDRLIGEGFLGEAEAEVAKGKPACKRFEARIIVKRTTRACRPRLRILFKVSLLLVEEEPIGAVAALDFAGGADGVYALKAARTCWVVTIGRGVSNGFSLVFLVAPTAISMAPRRTSNKQRTSPVRAAIFFVNSTMVGLGRNFLISASTSGESPFDRDAKRDWRISCSSTAVYGAKWTVSTFVDDRKVVDDEDVRVCVFAMPMRRKVGRKESVSVKIDDKDCSLGAI